MLGTVKAKLFAEKKNHLLQYTTDTHPDLHLSPGFKDFSSPPRQSIKVRDYPYDTWRTRLHKLCENYKRNELIIKARLNFCFHEVTGAVGVFFVGGFEGILCNVSEQGELMFSTFLGLVLVV